MIYSRPTFFIFIFVVAVKFHSFDVTNNRAKLFLV